ncbi:hypothetical protein SAMN05216553_105378 [Lentzea fradiae]|uniref:Uncharacterized protein n=1 Tax=Lentzea fradiae TaxID=200378 RepID=A0A1G7RJW9_9PSEU|nr:hypothetical protein SAMN05216553_105378 [Lentzea fradiae]
MTLLARTPTVSRNASIAAARLISLLPPGWTGRIGDSVEGTVLVIESAVPVGAGTALAVITSALADDTLRDWELGGCRPL